MFTSIVSGSDTFVPRAPGVYPEDSLLFNEPRFEVRLSGATPNRDKSLSGAATCLFEKDVTENGIIRRAKATFGSTIYCDKAFTPTDLLRMEAALHAFYNTSGYLTRLMQGES
jgi:hypothetical protein